jgi:hypothetical protein
VTTVLELHGIGVPPYSARGLSQTLTPIDAAVHLERNINGGLLDMSMFQFRKYKSTITGSDQQPPGVDGIWPGQVVTVDCIVELAYPDGGTPVRAVVPGSERFDGGWWLYRPRLDMRVVGFNINRDEYGAQVGWTLDLEEDEDYVS